MYNDNYNCNFKNWKDIVIGAVGILGLGYGIAMHTKLAKVSAKLDKSIDEIASKTEIDISEELVNRAIDKAVADEAKKAVDKATNEALAEIKRDIHATVSEAVNNEYDAIKGTVLETVTDEAAKIDISRVRKDVEKAAYAAAMTKFDANLDDILEKFNNNLDNTSKIYNSIASTMTANSMSRNNDKELVFKLM